MAQEEHPSYYCWQTHERWISGTPGASPPTIAGSVQRRQCWTIECVWLGKLIDNFLLLTIECVGLGILIDNFPPQQVSCFHITCQLTPGSLLWTWGSHTFEDVLSFLNFSKFLRDQQAPQGRAQKARRGRTCDPQPFDKQSSKTCSRKNPADVKLNCLSPDSLSLSLVDWSWIIITDFGWWYAHDLILVIGMILFSWFISLFNLVFPSLCCLFVCVLFSRLSSGVIPIHDSLLDYSCLFLPFQSTRATTWEFNVFLPSGQTHNHQNTHYVEFRKQIQHIVILSALVSWLTIAHGSAPWITIDDKQFTILTIIEWRSIAQINEPIIFQDTKIDIFP